MILIRSIYIMSPVLIFGFAMEAISVESSRPMMEICDNAIDDDLDGLIDLNDSDCTCIVIEPSSLIPNPSFEDMTCCPSNRSQLDCADVWIQASEPTTDYIHTCGWEGWENFPVPRPFPDGDAVMGFRDGRGISDGGFGGNDSDSEPNFNWKEYAGACLLGSLKANESYRFEFHVGFVDFQKSPSINISFFGTSDCKNLPFGVGNSDFGCPTNGPDWVRLGSRRVSGSGQWVKTSIDVVPNDDIQAIAIGPDCPNSTAAVNPYYFFDELILADRRSFEFVIAEQGHPCADEFTLSIIKEDDREYQWYLDGVALLNEQDAGLTQMYGEGDYQVRIITDGSCSLAKEYTYTIPVIDNNIREIICEQETYQFGNSILDEAGQYVEIFKNRFNCDSVVGLTLEIQETMMTDVDAKIFEGETYHVNEFSFKDEGDYDASLMTTVGCDSIVHLTLEYYEVYLPTAFSPNGDGYNDVFVVMGDDDLVQVNSLVIYDRWGGEVFSSQSSEDDYWDGKRDGGVVEAGTYVYTVSVVMDDGIERSLSGAVAVVR